jgi:phosphoglycolate phosphatase
VTRRYDAVVFDLDGTLLDTLDDLKAALDHVRSTVGLGPLDVGEVRKLLGNGYRKFVASALPGGSHTPGFEGLLEGFKVFYGEHCDVRTRPYPHVDELLGALDDAGVACAVVSNKGHEAVRDLVRRHFDGLLDPDLSFGEKAGIPRKPAPDMVHIALDLLGVDADRALYVGDSEVDHATARAAGVDCALVSWGFRSRDVLEALHPTFLVDDVSSLERVILGIRP